MASRSGSSKSEGDLLDPLDCKRLQESCGLGSRAADVLAASFQVLCEAKTADRACLQQLEQELLWLSERAMDAEHEKAALHARIQQLEESQAGKRTLSDSRQLQLVHQENLRLRKQLDQRSLQLRVVEHKLSALRQLEEQARTALENMAIKCNEDTAECTRRLESLHQKTVQGLRQKLTEQESAMLAQQQQVAELKQHLVQENQRALESMAARCKEEAAAYAKRLERLHQETVHELQQRVDQQQSEILVQQQALSDVKQQLEEQTMRAVQSEAAEKLIRQKYRSLKERMATLLFSPRRPADKAEDKHGPLSQHSADSALGSSRPDSNSGRRESKVNLAGSSSTSTLVGARSVPAADPQGFTEHTAGAPRSRAQPAKAQSVPRKRTNAVASPSILRAVGAGNSKRAAARVTAPGTFLRQASTELQSTASASELDSLAYDKLEKPLCRSKARASDAGYQAALLAELSANKGAMQHVLRGLLQASGRSG